MHPLVLPRAISPRRFAHNTDTVCYTASALTLATTNSDRRPISRCSSASTCKPPGPTFPRASRLAGPDSDPSSTMTWATLAQTAGPARRPSLRQARTMLVGCMGVLRMRRDCHGELLASPCLDSCVKRIISLAVLNKLSARITSRSFQKRELSDVSSSLPFRWYPIENRTINCQKRFGSFRR